MSSKFTFYNIYSLCEKACFITAHELMSVSNFLGYSAFNENTFLKERPLNFLKLSSKNIF